MATNVATLSELRAPAAPANLPMIRAGFFDAQGFELMQRVSKAFASSSLVPPQYQGNLANCMIAVNMAQRIGADPLMTMQHLYIVHERPAWSAQFMIACFNQNGRFSAIRYEWFGTKGADSWGCRAYATEKETGEKIVGPDITIDLAKAEGWYGKKGSKWQTMPQLMLMYRAAAWLVRSHAPEIAMGLQTAEEVHDVYDATRGEDGAFDVTLGDLRAEHAAAGETTDTATGEIKPVAPDSGLEPAPNAPDPRKNADAPTYAAVAEAIKAAGDADALTLAIDLIRSVPNERQRAELELEALARKKAIGQ